MDMVSLLPVRFYGYDSIIYLICAVIGFLISYKAFKLYDISKKNPQLFLSLSFTILSIGLLTMSLTSAFSYAKYFTIQEHIVFNETFDVADLGYWIYFMASIVAYVLLVLMYMPQEKNKFLLALPISINYYSYFNVILFFLIAFVAFRSIMNYVSSKSKSTLLVMVSFLLISLYHATLLFTPFHKIFYIIAHLSLIFGFASLLFMLMRVNKK